MAIIKGSTVSTKTCLRFAKLLSKVPFVWKTHEIHQTKKETHTVHSELCQRRIDGPMQYQRDLYRNLETQLTNAVTSFCPDKC